jgi:hypothetical protein
MGQAFHFPVIFAVPIPCSYLVGKERRRPHIDEHLTLIAERVLETRACLGQLASSRQKCYLVEMTARSIKRLSKKRNKLLIMTDEVNDNFPNLNGDIGLLQNIPLPLDAKISEGATVFVCDS